MYLPLNYDQINGIAGRNSPATQKNKNNKTYDYWIRQLFLRVRGKLKFNFDYFTENKIDYLAYVMLINGYVGFGSHESTGFFGSWCTARGFDFYYQPVTFLVANHIWNEAKEFTIGIDGALVRSMPDYLGIYDILTYYAEKLSLLDNATNMSLINSKMPYILGGKSKGANAALKKILDKVNKGESAVFYDSRISDVEKNEPFQHLELFDKNKYITDLLLADRQTILNDFDTEVGIKSIPYNKKERLVTDEANIKQDEANTKLNVMINTMNEDLKIVNDLFGFNFSVEAIEEDPKEPEEGGVENGSRNDINS